MTGRKDINLEAAKDRLHLDATDNVGNAYRTVIVAAKRVRQLGAGSPRRVERKWGRFDLTALDEIAQKKVKPVIEETD